MPAITGFDLSVQERESPGRIFKLRSRDDGSLTIEFQFDESDTVFRLVQLADSDDGTGDRCFLIDLNSNTTQTLSGRNFSDLLSRNEGYFNERFIPLLDSVKIELQR